MGTKTKTLIDGVHAKQLKVFPDDRGFLMEILRADDKEFQGFGQVYITSAYPGVTKAWHWHQQQDDCFCVLVGMAQVALYDRRKNSPTFNSINEFFIGEKNPMIITIPKGVCHGFKCIGLVPCILQNVVTVPFNFDNPDENRIPYNDEAIGYDWEANVNH